MDQAAAHALGRRGADRQRLAARDQVQRMHVRIDGGKATLLIRTGLDWSHRYKPTIEALGSLASTTSSYPVQQAKCFVTTMVHTTFAIIQLTYTLQSRMIVRLLIYLFVSIRTEAFGAPFDLSAPFVLRLLIAP